MADNLPKRDRFRFATHYVVAQFKMFFDESLSEDKRSAARESAMEVIGQYRTS